MKKAFKSKKIISLMLAIMMVVGMVPAASLPAAAVGVPDDIYGGEWLSLASEYDIFYTLRNTLNSSLTIAYRLDDDCYYELEPSEMYDKGYNDNGGGGYVFAVDGKKYIDLNGHALYLDWHDGMTSTLFKVLTSGDLTIIDSKGGGLICYDGRIFDGADSGAGHCAVRNIFEVYGKLTVNSGEIKGGGRSKRQWLTNARNQSDGSPGHAGYVRNQVNGTGITVEDGGELVVNGGRISGRGFQFIERTVGPRCWAIFGDSNAKVTINDGWFRGNGCADVISKNIGDLTVYGGTFSTHKIDKVRVADISSTQPAYQEGSYGDIGIDSEDLAPGAAVTVSGEEADIDENGNVILDSGTGSTTKVTPPTDELTNAAWSVEPSTGLSVQSSQISGDVKTTNVLWKPGSTGILIPHFSDSDLYYTDQTILANDYLDDTFQSTYYYWKLAENGKWVGQGVSTEARFDVNTFTDNSGNPYSFKLGSRYQVYGYQKEVWNGESGGAHHFEVTRLLGKVQLICTELDVAQVSQYSPLTISTPAEGNAQARIKESDGTAYQMYRGTVNANLSTVLNNWKTSGSILDWKIKATYYEVSNNERIYDYTVFSSENYGGSVHISTTQEGVTPIHCVVSVQLPGGAWDEIYSKDQDTLILSDITAANNCKRNGLSQYVQLLNPTNTASYVRLNTNLYRMVQNGTDVLSTGGATGDKLNASEFFWQYRETDMEDWATIAHNTTGMKYGSDTGLSGDDNDALYVRKEGWYRACYTVDGVTYVSPKPVYLQSDAVFTSYPAKAVLSDSRTVFGGELQFHLI